MSPFSILMIFFETYWGWNGDVGDLMSVLLMSFMEFILTDGGLWSSMGIHMRVMVYVGLSKNNHVVSTIFGREPLGETGVNNP
jgi:hypothetical protein